MITPPPITRFEEGKYYVVTGPGNRWDSYEGPWDSQDDAVTYLKLFVNEHFSFSPEMLQFVVVAFKNDQIDLVKVDGEILNGEYLKQKLISKRA